MRVTGRGSRVLLNLPSGALVVSVFRFPFSRRKVLRSIASRLELLDISLDVIVKGRHVARVGADTSRYAWPRLFGLRGLELYPRAMIRAALGGSV